MKNQSNQVKERPIIFSGEMVKAILDGKKTMTRRAVKTQPRDECTEIATSACFGHVEYRSTSEDRQTQSILAKIKCPYGKIGDRLWVRETWIQGYDDPLIESEGDDENAVSIIYKADGKEEYRTCSAETAENWGDFSADSEMVGFKSPIHMPRWASRILLEITDIRVERLNDISEADCEKEGFRFYPLSRICFKPCSTKHPSGHGSNNYKSIFGEYWDTLNAKKGYPWSSNPWVWVVEFKVVEVA